MVMCLVLHGSFLCIQLQFCTNFWLSLVAKNLITVHDVMYNGSDSLCENSAVFH